MVRTAQAARVVMSTHYLFLALVFFFSFGFGSGLALGWLGVV